MHFNGKKPEVLLMYILYYQTPKQTFMLRVGSSVEQIKISRTPLVSGFNGDLHMKRLHTYTYTDKQHLIL